MEPKDEEENYELLYHKVKHYYDEKIGSYITITSKGYGHLVND